jgi:hypothetical protein
MIQRIQTIWLLLSLAAWGSLFFGPTFSFTSESGGAWVLGASAVKHAETAEVAIKTIPLAILFAVVEFLTLISIFLYKNRTFQLRITLYNMILQVFSYGLIALYVIQATRQLDAKAGLMFLSIIPLFCFILSLLAFRGIRRDILVLKMVDRLR